MYHYFIIFLGILGIILTFLAYYFYICDTYKHKTKPHIFSWIVWGIVMGVGGIIQLESGGGIGSYIVILSSILAFVIVVVGYYRNGWLNITKSDTISFVCALIAVFLWLIWENPFISVIIIIIIEVLGFYPTIRKSYSYPQEETLNFYTLGVFRYSLGITSLQSFSFLTIAYPLSLIFLHIVLIILVLIRRKQLLKSSHASKSSSSCEI